MQACRQRLPGDLEIARREGCRLRVASAANGTLIADEALARVFDYANGMPRRINQVCTLAHMAARIDQKSVIKESTLRKAIAERDHE
jgi:type II secretory pathway predicted ATPase ExeA